MTTAVAPAGKPASTALVPQAMSQELINKQLRELGFYDSAPMSTVNRIKVDGQVFTAGDETYFSNPKTGKPAMLVRIIDVPEEYQGVWLTPTLAAAINRPADANTYCKSMFKVESQARKYSADGHDCSQCPIGPFVKKELLPSGDWPPGTKCKSRAELLVQILAEDGSLTDDTVWLFDLSFTGVMEFKGISGKNAVADEGYFAGQPNFIKRLADMGIASNPDDPQKGFLRALTALRLGAVIAEVRSIPAKGGANGENKFNVIQFIPAQILDVDETAAGAALEAGHAPTADNEDLPF